jgi:hypothetical protein
MALAILQEEWHLQNSREGVEGLVGLFEERGLPGGKE